ncbi:Mobile element protein [Frigoriglobus tundricola]|uniref:Mobile element protein n=1 Tax=Frigoriglobus tundricola TaxID=2774151 RepID=A0A6M5YL37_9BACT|nr:Mobile element protein [Frigoriglobus tundricola]
MALTFESPDRIFLFDYVSFPKQGTHSVGVQRQYCGALGKKANGQVPSAFTTSAPKVTTLWISGSTCRIRG